MDDVRSPAVDVVFLHDPPHTPHPARFLFGIHGQAMMDSIGELLRIVGIDDQRIFQFARRPVNWLKISTPLSSSRAATNSLDTRFMPSCSEVTRQRSAAR